MQKGKKVERKKAKIKWKKVRNDELKISRKEETSNIERKEGKKEL